jgi:hypothetical protein
MLSRFFEVRVVRPVSIRAPVVRWRAQDVDHPPPQLRSGLGCEFVIIDPEMADRIDQFIDRFVELADKLEE